MIKVRSRLFSTWMHERLARSVAANRSVALLVDHSEIKDKTLDCLSHLHGIEDFQRDLAMQKSMWINLKSGHRCLLLQNPKALAEGDNKSLEEMGKMA